MICPLVRDSEPIRLLELPTSPSLYMIMTHKQNTPTSIQGPRSNFEIGGAPLVPQYWGAGGAQDTFSY